MRKLVSLLLISLFLSSVPAVLGHGSEEEAREFHYEATKVTSPITIDGKEDEWSNINASHVELESFIGNEEEFAFHLKIAYDDEYIYYLIEVEDDYDFNASSHALSPAIGIAANINASSPMHMGAEDENSLWTSTGYVDIMHWEVETEQGVLVGGGDGTGDGKGNLDDEYASTPSKRFDDDGANAENSYQGTWTYTNGTEGEEGHYTFEIRRDLQTGDTEDVQFEEGEEYALNFAYWSPDETADGWTPSGHYTLIGMFDLSIGEHNENALPFAPIYLVFLAFVAIPLVRKFK